MMKGDAYTVKAETMINLNVKVELKSKTRFSSKHIRCACLCVKECDEIEGEYEEGSIWDEKNAELYENDISYASGSIISSVAYLESTINEFYSDCCDKVKNYKSVEYLNGIDLKTLVLLADKWNCDKFEMNKTLVKYDQALKIVTMNCFDTKEKTYIDAKNLLRMRNSLVHYKAMWQGPVANESPYNLNHLKGKFDMNPFMENSDNEFFPYKCLGKGCARWGIKSAIDFASSFYDKIGVKPLVNAQNIFSSILK